MFGWTLLIIVSLFLVTLCAVAGKYLPRPQKPYWSILLLIIILISGGFLTIHSSKNLAIALQRKNWPTVMGRVVIAEATSGGIIKPMVIYSYATDGRAYIDTSDLQVPGFGNRSKQHDVAQKLAAEYPIGRELLVHYDPEDFANSVLIVTPRWNIYVQIGLGLVLFTNKLFFLILSKIN